jgi:fructokinase
MILCCGEALIDFLPRETKDGALAYQPFSGGSVFNTAMALGRLGVETGFFGGMSSDFFGDQLRATLSESNVDYSFAPVSERYTIAAFVKLTDGHARYVFVDEGSACRSIELDDLPVLSPAITALHMGSIPLIPEPSGTTIETLCARESDSRVISLDPNIRPGLVKDKAAHIARIARMAAHADIMKLSDEDLNWIAPEADEQNFARDWLARGTKVLIVTRGGEGATAYTKSFKAETAPVKVKVADTVGAGDTFTAGTLAALSKANQLTKEALASVNQKSLEKAIAFAARAAAVTVSRPGADPPWAKEL